MATQLFYTPNTVATTVNAASATGAGVSFAMPNYGYTPGPPSKFVWQTAFTGGPGSVSITLESSIDGTHWFTLDTSTSTSGEIRTIVDKCAKFVRGNVGTLDTGTATVTFVAAQ